MSVFPVNMQIVRESIYVYYRTYILEKFSTIPDGFRAMLPDKFHYTPEIRVAAQIAVEIYLIANLPARTADETAFESLQLHMARFDAQTVDAALLFAFLIQHIVIC